MAVHIDPLSGGGPALQKYGIIDYYGIILTIRSGNDKTPRVKSR
jgi:hypothetical protein